MQRLATVPDALRSRRTSLLPLKCQQTIPAKTYLDGPLRNVNDVWFLAFAFGVRTATLVGSLVLLGYGRRLGVRHLGGSCRPNQTGLEGIQKAVIWLVVLLLVFAFQGALQRYDERQRLTLEEATAITTVHDYLDLLPAEVGSSMKKTLETYLEHRLELTRRSVSFSIWEGAATYSVEEKSRVLAIANAIRAESQAICGQSSDLAACTLLLPALSRMFDAAANRSGANQKHPPHTFFAMLLALGLAASLLTGFGMAAAAPASSLHTVTFATLLSVMLYVITDLEFPRLGLIKLDSFDHVLEDALRDMG